MKKLFIVTTLLFLISSCTQHNDKITTPQPKVKFYRVVQVDKDGKRTTSIIIKANVSPKK